MLCAMLCAMLFLSTVVLHISAFVCSHNVICIADYHLSPWHVSLIIRALWYCHHGFRYFADYDISLLHSSWNMFCWLSAIAMTCFAGYQNFVLLSTWCHIIRWLSELYAPCSVAYVSFFISSFHDMFRWLSHLCATSPWRQIFRWLSDLYAPFSMKCLADFQLSPWHVSLIITALCCSCHGVRYFTDYQSPVVVSPWHRITHWMQ